MSKNTPITLHTNIAQYPPVSSLIPKSEGEWLIFGDMHGNALKLLHIMVLSRVATVSKEDYHFFVEIYQTPFSTWLTMDLVQAKKYFAKLDAMLDRIVIDKTVRLRLLGDLLCDRGANDFFTLKLLGRLIGITDQNNLEIIMSNHDVELTERHERSEYGNYRYAEDKAVYLGSGISAREKKSVRSLTNSLLNLHEFIKMGFVSYDMIESLYNEYKKHVKFIAYDSIQYDERDAPYLPVSSHTVTNGVYIFLAGLCLIEEGNRNLIVTELGLSIERIRRIEEIVAGVVDNPHNTLELNHLITIIDALNDLASHCYQKNRVTDFLHLKFNDERMRGFTPYPNSPVLAKSFALTFSLRFFTQFRGKMANELAFKAEEGGEYNIIQIQNTFCTHGHLGDVPSINSNCINLDTLCGKAIGFETGDIYYTKQTATAPRVRMISSPEQRESRTPSSSSSASSTQSLFLRLFPCFGSEDAKVDPCYDERNKFQLLS